jgi:hypothetical protein
LVTPDRDVAVVFRTVVADFDTAGFAVVVGAALAGTDEATSGLLTAVVDSAGAVELVVDAVAAGFAVFPLLPPQAAATRPMATMPTIARGFIAGCDLRL